MSKIVYDIIQRFEVENGVLHLVSTNIEIVGRVRDLISLASKYLLDLGFEYKYKKICTPLYIGYRARNPIKKNKRNQLVLKIRKEEISISLPKDVLIGHILEVGYWTNNFDRTNVEFSPIVRMWVLPSKREIFCDSINPVYNNNKRMKGRIELNKYEKDERKGLYVVVPNSEIISMPKFTNEIISNESCYLKLTEDRLFPYCFQVSIYSEEVLEEFINYFGKILMDLV